MLTLLDVPRRMVATMFFVVALIGALAVIAPSSASAIPPPPTGCRISENCPPTPAPKPPPPPQAELVAQASAEDHFRDHHQEATTGLHVVRSSNGQPVRAYVKTTVHAWNHAWYEFWSGFRSVSQVRINVDGWLAASSAVHKLTVCGWFEDCHDVTETWIEDVPLGIVTTYERDQIGLAIDLSRERD